MGKVSSARLLFLVILLVSASGCATSLNADEFISATLSGRQGEIRSGLAVALTQDEKLVTARYLASVEPLAREMLSLAEQVAVLEVSTRQGRDEIIRALRLAAERSASLVALFRRLEPPSSLRKAHDRIVSAYEDQARATADYVEAYGALDFRSIAEKQKARGATAGQAASALSDLERDAAPLFQSGREWRFTRG